MTPRRLVVGISGSSGVILGIRLLQVLRDSDIETHLVLTPAGRLTIAQETSWKVADVLALAKVAYPPRDIGAAIASGSFATLGMVVIPCSIKTLSAVANCYTAGLLTRAADVTLKEGRPLVLVVRETPLHRGHIRQMDQAAEAGAVIFPPVPAFYTHPQTIDDLVNNLVGRVLVRLGIENDQYQRWEGLSVPAAAAVETGGQPSAGSPKPGYETLPAGLLALPALTLATTGPDGEPHAAPVYFAADGTRALFFFSNAISQHSLDLAANPRAAAALHPLVSGWQEIQGLQLRGSVRAVAPGAEWDRGWALYQAKFPFVGQLKEALARTALYVFEPDWVRRVDNPMGNCSAPTPGPSPETGEGKYSPPFPPGRIRFVKGVKGKKAQG